MGVTIYSSGRSHLGSIDSEGAECAPFLYIAAGKVAKKDILCLLTTIDKSVEGQLMDVIDHFMLCAELAIDDDLSSSGHLRIEFS